MRRRISSRSPWEPLVGFSRAVAIGNVVYVAGTAPYNEQGQLVGVGDVYTQAVQCLRTIERALVAAGSSMNDVVRTRIYITDRGFAADVGRAHAEYFRDIRPAATMVVVAGLVDPAMLVEIEADAVRGE
ncbi:MAG: RidA family protein [Ignavibacteriae bacterium]|nr:RidA family protein [Ignavibacteriota bacterium]